MTRYDALPLFTAPMISLERGSPRNPGDLDDLLVQIDDEKKEERRKETECPTPQKILTTARHVAGKRRTVGQLERPAAEGLIRQADCEQHSQRRDGDVRVAYAIGAEKIVFGGRCRRCREQPNHACAEVGHETPLQHSAGSARTVARRRWPRAERVPPPVVSDVMCVTQAARPGQWNARRFNRARRCSRAHRRSRADEPGLLNRAWA